MKMEGRRERRTFMVNRREDMVFGARAKPAEFEGVAMIAPVVDVVRRSTRAALLVDAVGLCRNQHKDPRWFSGLALRIMNRLCLTN